MYYNMNDIDIRSSNNFLRKVFLYMILGIAISFGTGAYLLYFNQKIFYFNSSFIKVKQNKNDYILSILIDTIFDKRIELTFNSLDEIEEFIINTFLVDTNFENYNVTFAFYNGLDFDYSLYSVIKFYKKEA